MACGLLSNTVNYALVNRALTTVHATSTPLRPNIILIMADALRADRVSAYASPHPTTPNIVSWIKNQGVMFQQATSPATWTFPANVAIMTGRSPISMGISWDNVYLASSATTLAEQLHAIGYYTAAFISAPFLKQQFNLTQGFDVYDQSSVKGNAYFGVADVVNTAAKTWFQNSWQASMQPLFLWLYYFDPHTWYNPGPPYDTLYDPTTLAVSVARFTETALKFKRARFHCHRHVTWSICLRCTMVKSPTGMLSSARC